VSHTAGVVNTTGDECYPQVTTVALSDTKVEREAALIFAHTFNI